MTSTHERAKQIFMDALDQPTAERQAFIDRSCADDAELLARVQELIHLHDNASDFMETPTAASLEIIPIREDEQSQIGPYRLLEKIGEGGFGVVFMAEQREPLQRCVALKVIKVGMDTKQVIARFEAERQSLALMDHPHIARVFDAGETDTGRPYFVMELVRGDPITHYADHKRLSIRERLEIFADVCDAVHHAHQKGVIHRDLKPGNILVADHDGRAVPKVIDFGIAKAMNQRLTERTLFTEFRQFIGTPAYVSPEQATFSGLDIDTRSDVYTLGVLLYELLTGSTPFDENELMGAGLAEMEQIIREVEPPKPSARISTLGATLTTVSKARGLDETRFSRALRGELDWIVMRAMEKDRRRRYDSAAALATDIRRYLQDEPVEAGPPSAMYRMRKFARRNRTAVVAGSVVTLAVLGGLAGTSWGLWQAVTAWEAESIAKTEAQQRADELDQVAEFQANQLSDLDVETMGVSLRRGLIQKVRDAAIAAGESEEEADKRAAEIEERIAGADFTGLALETLNENIFTASLNAIDEEFGQQPLVRARLLHSLGASMHELGLYDSAMQPKNAALAIRMEHLGPEHPDTLNSEAEQALLLWHRGELDEAEARLRGVFARHRAVLGPDDRQTLQVATHLGTLLLRVEKLDEAEAILRDALDRYEQHFKDSASIDVRSGLGATLTRRGKFEEAEAYARQVLDLSRQVHGEDDPLTLTYANNLANVLDNLQRFDEAESLYLEVLDRKRSALGNDHPSTLTTLDNLGRMLESAGRADEAEHYLKEALDGRRRVLGDHHPSTLRSMNNYALVLSAIGKPKESTEYHREILEIRRRVLGEDHSSTLMSMHNLAENLHMLEGPEASLPLREELVTRARSVLGNDHWYLALYLSGYGLNLMHAGHYTEGEAAMIESHAIMQKTFGDDHPRTQLAIRKIIACYEAWDRAEPGSDHSAEIEDWRERLAD